MPEQPTTTSDTPPGAPAGDEPAVTGAPSADDPGEGAPDLEARRAALIAELVELDRQRQDVDSRHAGKQEELNVLERRLKAADRVLNSFGGELLAQRKAQLDAYRATKRAMVDAVVGDQREAIEKAIRAVDDEVKAAEKKLADAEGELTKRQEELAGLVVVRDAARRDLAALDGLGAANRARLDRADALRREIEQRDDVNDPRGMHFVLGELDSVLAEVELPDADTLRTRHQNASRELAEAEDALAKADQASRAAEKPVADARADLDEVRGERRQKIFERLAKLPGGPAEDEV